MLLIFIFTILFVPFSVSADEMTKFEVSYCNVEDSSECYTATLDLNAQVSYFNYVAGPVIIYNFLSGADPYFFQVKPYDLKTFQDGGNAYEYVNNGYGAPPYLYLFADYSNGTQYYAALSDIEYDSETFEPNYYHLLEIFKTVEIEVNENNEIVDDVKNCDYEGTVYGHDISAVLTINNTKKAMSMTTPTVRTDLMFEYKTNSGCYETLYFCDNPSQGVVTDDQVIINVFYDLESSCEYYQETSCSEENMYHCEKLIANARETGLLVPGCAIINNVRKKHKGMSTASEKINYVTEMKQYCRTIFENVDFTSVCVDECLTFEKEANKLLSYSNSGTSCGFSDRILNFVGNIMKWVKYIMPVLVILFGILDFIKAICGDKDEELKKAQGRVVKRLISAALVFIIPFIIEFVLDKMGFVTNGCGIVDL